MEVSTVGGGGVGLTDVSVCLSFLTCWEIKGTVERKKKKNSAPYWQLSRGQLLFLTPEPDAADHFNNIIHMNFHITWKKNLTGGGGCVLYLVKIGLEKSLMSAALHDSTPLRLRGIKSLEAIHPRQTARSVTSAPLMLTTPRTSRRPHFSRH